MTLPENTLPALKRRADKARKFPENTCPASRHVRLIAEALADKRRKGLRYPMLEDEPEHCAESLYATVISLWEARTALARLSGKTWPAAIAEADAVSKPANAA